MLKANLHSSKVLETANTCFRPFSHYKHSSSQIRSVSLSSRACSRSLRVIAMLSLHRSPMVSSASTSTRLVSCHVHGISSSSSRHLACRFGTPHAVPAALSRPVSTAAAYHLGRLVASSKKDAKRYFEMFIWDYKGKPRGLPTAHDQIHPGDKGFEELWYLWHHHPEANASHEDYVDKDITHFRVKGYRTVDSWRSLRLKSSEFCVYYTSEDEKARPHSVSRWDGCTVRHCSTSFKYHHCIDNKQHAETTKNGGWAGPLAPKTSEQLAEANRQARAFAALLGDQLASNPVKKQTPDSFYFSIMRKQVAHHIKLFKEKIDLQEFTCPINGSEVPAESGHCHVDHYDPPFVVLAEMWLQQEGLKLSDVGCWDSQQEVSWMLFHGKHAKLRLVSKSGNLSQSFKAKLARADFKQQQQQQQQQQEQEQEQQQQQQQEQEQQLQQQQQQQH